MRYFLCGGNSKRYLGKADSQKIGSANALKIISKLPNTVKITKKTHKAHNGNTYYFRYSIYSDDISRDFNLGAIFEDKIIKFNLYNASGSDAVLVAINTPDGVEVSGISVGDVLKNDESRLVNILVSSSSTANTDDDIIFVFDNQVLRFHLKALKVKVFTYKPIFSYSEAKEIKTDIFTAQDGKEIRTASSNLIRKIYFKITTKEIQDNAGLKHILAYSQKNEILAPLWFSATTILNNGNNAFKLSLNTDLKEFKKGDFALIWRDNNDYSVFEIENISKNEITSKDPKNFKKGDLLLPLIKVTPNYSIDYEWMCQKISEYEVIFKELL